MWGRGSPAAPSFIFDGPISSTKWLSCRLCPVRSYLPPFPIEKWETYLRNNSILAWDFKIWQQHGRWGRLASRFKWRKQDSGSLNNSTVIQEGDGEAGNQCHSQTPCTSSQHVHLLGLYLLLPLWRVLIISEQRAHILVTLDPTEDVAPPVWPRRASVV